MLVCTGAVFESKIICVCVISYGEIIIIIIIIMNIVIIIVNIIKILLLHQKYMPYNK